MFLNQYYHPEHKASKFDHSVPLDFKVQPIIGVKAKIVHRRKCAKQFDNEHQWIETIYSLRLITFQPISYTCVFRILGRL